MPQDPLAVYKLIILYMLNRVTYPLTTAQLHDYILETDYVDFLTLQQAISELKETNMITAKSLLNRTLLEITPEGQDTIRLLSGHIRPSTRQNIDRYLKENEFDLRNETSVQANYYKSTITNDYEARLTIRERETNLMDLTLSVPTEELASRICANWQTKNEAIYQTLIQELFSPPE